VSNFDHLAQAVNHDRETVISGAAMITCLGIDRATTWQAVRAGKCGVAPLHEIESDLPTGADGGEAVALPNDDDADEPRHVRYLRFALKRAIADAGLSADQIARSSIILGTTLHGMRSGGAFLRDGNHEHLKRFLAPSVLNAATRGLGISGPSLTTCSACSSSLSTVALGVTLLQSGQADIVIAGGYDSISEYAYAGFSSLRLVAQGPLRSFARDREGMKVGEGYGIIVLERADDVARRGGRVIAHVLGVGESADAHHLTQPHPRGEGASSAITAALRSAEIQPADINLIAAHATGTPDNDAAEYAALHRVFGDDLSRVPVVAFKTHLSHTLGGAGAVELVLSAMALDAQIVPPCANVTTNDTDFPGLSLASGAAKPAALEASMNLSLGFGGANTCVVLGKSRKSQTKPAPDNRDVFITGIGVMVPGVSSNEAFLSLLNSSPRATSDAKELDQESLARILNARRIRRMSSYVKLSLAGAMLALQDAGVAQSEEFLRTCCGMLGTTHAAAQYCADYYGQIVREGISAANPLLFAEGVPNAAAAHLSLATGMRGACQTIIGSRTSGVDALGLAALRISSGQWDRALVAAADEYCPTINSAFAHCGLYSPQDPAAPFGEKPGTFVAGWGAAALVLESRSSVEKRAGAKVRGRVLKYSAGTAGEGKHVQIAARVLAELSDPETVMSSANGTWIDRVEAGALRESAKRTGRAAKVSSLSGHIAECFSAGPIAAIAAVLLGGRLPPMLGTALATTEKTREFAALATDYNGSISGVNIGVHLE
jgi:3-oxoacyl-[acyl-carrier-protein] synthase II